LAQQYAWKEAAAKQEFGRVNRETFMSRIQILGKNPVSWFYESLRRYGLGQTLIIIWSVTVDMLFDFHYGTDTARRIPRNEIETDSENIVHCVNYGASKAMPFMRLMRRLKLPREGVFVDLGSGKGRALMLAAKYGFRKVIGIEFSGALCSKARVNLQNFLRKCPSRSQIEIIESDVTKYRLRDDETVFFMLDPFNAPVLSQVLGNIQASLKRFPRTIWLIYSVPREQDSIEQSGIFTKNQLHVIVGAEFRVFTNEPIAGV
jgi:SAM-dependent methyltransferase